MRTRSLAALATAILVANADLLTKALVTSSAAYDHHRSGTWMALSSIELAAMAALALLPSRALALTAGLVAGGTLGNLVSALAHHRDVPNPFVLHFGEGGIAFNVADVAFVTGQLLLTVAAMRLAIRHRDKLPTSTLAVRLLRRART